MFISQIYIYAFVEVYHRGNLSANVIVAQKDFFAKGMFSPRKKIYT